jgi:hypothetical protein
MVAGVSTLSSTALSLMLLSAPAPAGAGSALCSGSLKRLLGVTGKPKDVKVRCASVGVLGFWASFSASGAAGPVSRAFAASFHRKKPQEAEEMGQVQKNLPLLNDDLFVTSREAAFLGGLQSPVRPEQRKLSEHKAGVCAPEV